MINRSVFCPYERVLAVAISQLRDVEALQGGCIRLAFDDGFVTKKYLLTKGAAIDNDLGRTENQRDSLLCRDSFEVTLTIISQDGSESTRAISVSNVLLTDAPVLEQAVENGKVLVNGTAADGSPCFYPEAYFTTNSHTNLVIADDASFPSLIRPLYQFVLESVSPTGWTIFGPSNILYSYTGVGKAELYQYNANTKAYAPRVAYNLVEKGELKSVFAFVDSDTTTVSTLFKDKIKVILSDGRVSTEFVFTKRPIGIDGTYLAADDILSIMQLLVYIEFNCQESYDEISEVIKPFGLSISDGGLVLPAESFNGRTRLSRSLSDAIDTYCKRNVLVANVVTDNYAIINDILCFKDLNTNKYIAVCGNSDQDSHVLSLITLWNDSIFRGTWSDLFSLPRELIATKLVLTTEQCIGAPEGITIMTGSTASSLLKAKTLEFDMPLCTSRLTVKRSDTYRDDNTADYMDRPDGLYILGYSFARDRKQGAPDKYIVVEKISDQLFVRYDPVANAPVPNNTNVTSLLGTRADGESVLIGFDAINKMGNLIAIIGVEKEVTNVG